MDRLVNVSALWADISGTCVCPLVLSFTHVQKPDVFTPKRRMHEQASYYVFFYKPAEKHSLKQSLDGGIVPGWKIVFRRQRLLNGIQIQFYGISLQPVG